jgi:hypothetical protein
VKATAPLTTVPTQPTAAGPVAVPPEATPPAAARPAHWPEFFVALDAVLAIVALVLAFLMASFAARNSDLWLHLAGGRQIAEGAWSLGADPMSFVDPERPWVRTSWLTDLVGYVAYRADPSGVVLVAGKAALFASAFGLLFFLRRPGQSLWPWAVAGTLAVLAAAPYATLRPAVVSMALLSLTLVLVYRLPWSRRSWREPLILAGVFAVWANADAYFFLGPIAVLCVLIGEALNRRLLGDSPAGEAGDPFFPAPPAGPLAKAYVLGLVACLLNPFLIAGLLKDPAEALAQLVPPELGFGLPAGVTGDTDLAFLARTPLSDDFQAKSQYGNGVNGYCFAALLVTGGVALAAGFARLRAAQVLVWVAFAALAFANTRFVPYFALVAVPLIGGHLNGLSARVTLGRAADPKTRILLTACGVGRVVCVLAGCLMLAATYPGWLHPQVGVRSYQTRLDWAVEPEPGLVRSAARMRDAHASGLVPDGRGLGVSPEFANYLAWYAPELRCFVDSRFAFHRHELPDLLAARKALRIQDAATQAEATARVKELARVAAEYEAEYLVVTASPQRVDVLASLQLLSDSGWVLWHLDGRMAIFGRLTGDPAADARVEARRFDAARVAFGPGQPRLPEAVPLPPSPVPVELAELYIDRPRPTPPETDDATVYAVYDNYARQLAGFRYGQSLDRQQEARMALLGGGRPTAFAAQPPEPEALAVPVLMIRAARFALSANPDSTEAFVALAEAYAMPGAPVLDLPSFPFFGGVSERQLQLITARHRLLERCPTLAGSGVSQPALLNSAQALAQLYEATQQVDAAQRAYDRYVGYFDSLQPAEQLALASQRVPGAAKPEDALKAFRKDVLDHQDRYSRYIQKQREEVARIPQPLQQFYAAIQRKMPLVAVEIFEKLPGDGGIPPDAAVAKVALCLRSGRLEEAAADLAALDAKLREAPRQGPGAEIALAFRELQIYAARLAGNPGSGAAALPRPDFPKVAFDPVAVRLPTVLPGLAALAGGPVGLLQSEQAGASKAPLRGYLARITQAREILIRESYASHDRALLALRDGNAAEARQWFADALKPQGVPLADLGDGDRAARLTEYVKLIDRAQKPPPY